MTSLLSKANYLMRNKNYKSALQQYNLFLNDYPELYPNIKINLFICESRLKKTFNNSSTNIPRIQPCSSLINRTILYSVVVGEHEPVKPIENKDPSVKYILFTDNHGLRVEGWEVLPIETKSLSPRRASRIPKLLPHMYLPEHEISIYIDSTLAPASADLSKLALDALSEADIAAYPHFQRNCVYEEIEECLRLGKADPLRSREFADRLHREKFPMRWGLLENAFLIRRNTPLIRWVNELWFREYITGPERDQFSLMYVLWRAKVPYACLSDALDFRKSPHFRWCKRTNARVCEKHPEPEEIALHFGFLAESDTVALKSACMKVVDEIVRKRGDDGMPCVSSKRIQMATEAIVGLEMLGNHNVAASCRFALAKSLFPITSQFAADRPIKLAYIANSAMPTEAANNVHVMKMCAALVEAGLEVSLYAERAPGYKGDGMELHSRFATRYSFPIFFEPRDKRGREHMLYRLLLRALKEGCTHIYSRSFEVALLASLADLPVILERHQICKPAQFAFMRFLIQSSSMAQLVAISKPLKMHYAAFKNNFVRKITILHDAADLLPEQPSPFILGLANRPGRNVGYVGHLYPGKGAELCHVLAQHMPEVSFHMLGGTPEDVSHWRQKASGLNNLVFHGHRPPSEVPGFIAAVDICIAPFLRRVMVSGGKDDVANVFSPLKIFEYMAQGKPIVASDLPVLREVLRDGETAFLCDPDRPETFVDSINRLITDPALGRSLGAAAKAECESHYTWLARAKAVMELFGHEKTRMPPPVAPSRHAPLRQILTKKAPLMRWFYGPKSDWAYGINAKRLSARMASIDHITTGSLKVSDQPLDIALAFDILIMQTDAFKLAKARKNILRIGGPNPLKEFAGGNCALLKEALAEADALIALSPQLCEELSELHQNVHFIPNGIDLSETHPVKCRRNPDLPFTVGMSAALSEENHRHLKGYYFAVEACEQAGVELTMIGRGLRHIPHEAMLEEFWSKIDVLLHPVDAGKEASSNIIMEALAWGVPVITTRHAGFHGAALEHGREALIMRRNVADFSEAIRALRLDPALRSVIAEEGRRFVEKHHDLDRIAQQYESVVQQVLQTKYSADDWAAQKIEK